MGGSRGRMIDLEIHCHLLLPIHMGPVVFGNGLETVVKSHVIVEILFIGTRTSLERLFRVEAAIFS